MRSCGKCIFYTYLYLSVGISVSSALDEIVDEKSLIYLPVNNINGETVLISEELMRKLEEDVQTWHWTPWLRTRIYIEDNIVREVERESNPLESFPESIFTDDQLRKGGFILYVIFGIYAFTFLAIICNDYFLPCVEIICDVFKIPQNVAAATFMSVATSCPEFFVNVFSTFLTNSDMGIGTIVGSAIFNALGVAAIGGLAAVYPIAIEKRPVTRDVVMYMANVGVLVAIVWDGEIEWFEALILQILYIIYFIIMFYSTKIFAVLDKFTSKCAINDENDMGPKTFEHSKPVEEGINNNAFSDEDESCKKPAPEKSIEAGDIPEKPPKSVWRFPKENSLTYRIWWVYAWPLKLILSYIIPSPVKYRKLFPIAFIMCIICIGANSYVVSWSMTVIGFTFGIPDSVMGMTFLAFGGCLPEALSIFIMSRRGEGGIGVSNALGANSLAILFALGLPWFIKTVALKVQGVENPVVFINSNRIDFVVGSLLVAVICLWLTLCIGKFKLRRSVGTVLSILYLIFITVAILVEMGVIISN